MSDAAARLPAVTFVWGQFAPYHRDRCAATAARLAGRFRVLGVEIASRNELYDWTPATADDDFEFVSLLPGRSWQDTSRRERFAALRDCLRGEDRGPVFLCHFDQPEIFLTALWLRLRGRPVFIMQDSKFDDRPRRLWRELGKALLYLPYHGALASGTRTRDYLRLLGMGEARISLGYDTVSLARVRRLAGAPPAPDGAPFAARQFLVIARFVEKKNLLLALAAYDAYRQASAAPRSLVLIGSGPLEGELRAEVARRNLAGVRFTGFLQEKGVAEFLAQGLALILPSTEEQWGLVINEALAMGLPALVSENVGARDDLVRVGVNGYVFEPDNAAGLARLMARLASDEDEWRRLSAGANELAPRGDVARFADAVARMIGDAP
ncbi:MAG: glycosyltransferase family 4 protein [Alphaproteobacteria bacterium]